MRYRPVLRAAVVFWVSGRSASGRIGRPDAWTVSPTGNLDKTVRAFDPHQVLLLPPSLDDWLPQDHLADHLARFIDELVDEVLDLGRGRKWILGAKCLNASTGQ
ncbi:hypothetical protein AB0D14_33585 [Streptomyces sp. NPDC048484]|uniref:hypothetical protein n=1 Tax=Streptomyces sp. NPDC048484 TaxID=3155146 RepID=UPI0034213EC6